MNFTLPELRPTLYCTPGQIFAMRTEYGNSVVIHPETLKEAARILGEDMVTVGSVARLTAKLWACAMAKAVKDNPDFKMPDMTSPRGPLYGLNLDVS